MTTIVRAIISQTPSARRWVVQFSVVVIVAAAASACTSEPQEPSLAPPYQPTTTIQDIMLSIVDPAADTIWESVATIVTFGNIEERRPSTEEEWQALHREGVRLVEATNLLLMPGRDVAHPGFQSENPGIELEPEEVQALIDEDRATWNRLLGNYYQAAVTMLRAIEARDADRLFDEGGPLDVTCEQCHQRYWYPGQTIPPSSTVGPEASAPAVEDAPTDAAAVGPTGTIQGHIRLAGDPPGNTVIRMGVDPRCAQITEGKLMVQESVLTSPDESLANVFVRLEGTFPDTPVPEEPVVIDQTDCVFVPRVVGARAGQLVQIKNNDPLLHNLNSQGSTSNRFNVGQPMQGMVHEVRLEEEESMLRIRCDLHRWMTEYIGVVSHPYFAVTDLSGTFVVDGVPTGTHTIQAWHEEYGVLTQTVTVEAGAVVVADFTYPPAT